LVRGPHYIIAISELGRWSSARGVSQSRQRHYEREISAALSSPARVSIRSQRTPHADDSRIIDLVFRVRVVDVGSVKGRIKVGRV
jgi:hypothetical protein